MAKNREAQAPSKPAPNPLDPVRVRNLGRMPWIGSDYAHVGRGVLEAGEVGVVTFKKFQQLQEHYPKSMGGVGPFELAED